MWYAAASACRPGSYEEKTTLIKIPWLAIPVFAVALSLPRDIKAQSGTVSDDAFLSAKPAMQALNLKGQGVSLVVAGSSAEFGLVQVGPSTSYIKFQLQSSLPAAIAAANVAKATLKLYVSPGSTPSGQINIYPVTSPWSESSLSSSSAPSLAPTPFAADVAVGKANSFLVLDVTQLVQQWLNGSANGGLDNDGMPSRLPPAQATSCSTVRSIS